MSESKKKTKKISKANKTKTQNRANTLEQAFFNHQKEFTTLRGEIHSILGVLPYIKETNDRIEKALKDMDQKFELRHEKHAQEIEFNKVKIARNERMNNLMEKGVLLTAITIVVASLMQVMLNQSLTFVQFLKSIFGLV